MTPPPMSRALLQKTVRIFLAVHKDTIFWTIEATPGRGNENRRKWEGKKGNGKEEYFNYKLKKKRERREKKIPSHAHCVTFLIKKVILPLI